MLPEIIIILTALSLLMGDLFFENFKKVPIALLGFLVAFGALLTLSPGEAIFGGRFILTPQAYWFKIIFIFAGLITVGLSFDSFENTKSHLFLKSSSEFITILMLTISGMMFLVSAQDIVTLYVSLEVSTIPLFALTAWNKEELRSKEAALKYLLSGALASALLLMGFSFLYGSTGTINITQMGEAITFSPIQVWAFILVTMGAGFKVGLVPFHFWAPDVYEGAPLPVTSFLSVGSKAAGVAVFVVFYLSVFRSQIENLNEFLALIATLTMCLGNLVAITQKNIKRFMAFSSISQAGYILMGFMGAESVGLSAILYYLLVYVFSNLVVFGGIMTFSSATGKEDISDFKGLSTYSPLLALSMMLALFSLAGIPPLSGFLGKFFLFSQAAKQGYHWLVVVAALNSTVSLYYYLGIIRQMYIEKNDQPQKLKLNPTAKWTMVGSTIMVVALGVFPQIYEMIHSQI